MAEPLFSPDKVRNVENKCLICNVVLSRNDAIRRFGISGWNSFKENAKTWSDINLPLQHELHVFTEVDARVCDVSEPFGAVHNTCRAKFGTKYERYIAQYGKISADISPNSDVEIPEEDVPKTSAELSPVKTRSKINSAGCNDRHCFVCNEKAEQERNEIRRCTDERGAALIDHRKNYYMKDKLHRFHEASLRLNTLLNGKSYDIFAKDIYYHKICYLKFSHPYIAKDLVVDDSQYQHALKTFFFKIRKKILKEKCAYFLHELHKDLGDICNDIGLDAIITCTKSLKRALEKEFGDSLGYQTVSKFVIVYSSDTNPCDYAVATLDGCGLRDADLVKSFGRLIRRKLESPVKEENKWPLTPDELIEEVNKGPSPELYNAIYYSMYDSGKINSYGFVGTDSGLLANKIWSVASDWESLVTRKATPKQVVLGLVLHRLTGSREVANYVHKSNHAISYDAIRMQNQAWARMVTGKKSHAAHLRKGVVTHSTIDNNDGRQETVTGAGTTHDTNKTLFQIPTKKQLSQLTVGAAEGGFRDLLTRIGSAESLDPKPYAPKPRVGPEHFPNYKDDLSRDELNFCFKRDVIWSLAGSLPDMMDGEAVEPIGSWTAFHKMISSSEPIKCVQEYLPVAPHPPEYPICKEYFDFLLEIIEDLDLPYMFVHSDEAIYSKLCDILWQNKDIYERIIILMGGFHEVKVVQRVIYKRYYSRRMDTWCVDSAVIAKGSADQAFEGRHYYRCLRMHKECFDALVQQRIETITKGFSLMDPALLAAVKSLRKNPNSKTFEIVMSQPSLDSLVEDITVYKQYTEEHVTVSYLKDVSVMLSMLSAVREGVLRRHLQAERHVLNLVFAFDHQNYAKYCTYQHVYLESLRSVGHPAFDDLVSLGFGASRSGDSFSSVHGDLITEYFNKETKGTAGPFRAGFSTDINAVNNWVRTIHIHCKLREQFREILHMKTSSKHKELTIGARKKHSNHVCRLRNQLRMYGIDPFSSDVPKSFSTGTEIPSEVSDNIINAADIGNTNYLAFIKERLVDGTRYFFDPIKKNQLKLGIKKKRKVPKAVEILKEDKQAFGLMVSKSVSMDEAFKYHITTVPLAIATTECTLRQSNKSQLRATLVESSGALYSVVPPNCAWFIDGMAVIRAADTKPTYKEFFDSIIGKVTPYKTFRPTLVGIINDTYKSRSTKAGTRSERGDPGPRTHIQGTAQHMPQGLRWKELLHNIENKTDLIELLMKYMQSFECRSKLPCEFIVTSKEKTMKVSKATVQVLEDCNHEEADTRLVLHAILCEQDSVIVASDTDVLVLLVWAYNEFEIKQKWYFQYESSCFADISVICEHFGGDVCSRLPAFHAFTGCDQASYFYGAGKSRVFEKALNTRCFHLLDALATKSVLTAENSNDLQEFVRKVVYSGNAKETYVQTKTRLYIKMKNKSSLGLPPDLDSLLQHSRRSQLQNLIWCSSGLVSIENMNPEDYSWAVDEENDCFIPVWFTDPQLSPSLQKRKRDIKTDAANEGDVESSDAKTGSKKVVRKKKKNTPPRERAPTKKQKTENSVSKHIPSKIPISTKDKSSIATGTKKTVTSKLPTTVTLNKRKNEDVESDVYGDDEEDQIECTDESSHDSWWEVSDFSSSNDSDDSDW